MRKTIDTFLEIKEKIHLAFELEEEYFLKPILDYKWDVREVDGMMFFKYIVDDKVFEQVVVRQKGENLFRVQGEYTLIVAIDCVKISFLVKNDNRVDLQ